MKLSIIIVNWNGRELLDNCLFSILTFPPACAYEVVIVDNASTDGSQEWLAERSAEFGAKLKVILNKENVGFGRANNQAMASSDADMFFLLNSDAALTSDSVDILLSAMNSDPRIGGVGPKLLGENGLVEPSVWRNPPAFWESLVSGLRIYKLLPERLRAELLLGQFWPHAERRKITFVNGAAMMIRRQVFEEVGGFDEDFFMYGEDMEYSLRISRAGWLLYFIPESKVVHKRAKSSVRKWGEIEKARVEISGYLKFYKKSLSRLQMLLLLSSHIAVARLELLRRRLWNVDRESLGISVGLYEQALFEMVTGVFQFRR